VLVIIKALITFWTWYLCTRKGRFSSQPRFSPSGKGWFRSRRFPNQCAAKQKGNLKYVSLCDTPQWNMLF